jgi:hypothetical protein
MCENITPFSFLETNTGANTDNATLEVVGDIIKYRGEIDTADKVGTINGPSIFTFNADINLSTLKGVTWGNYLVTSNDIVDPVTGRFFVWAGTYKGTYEEVVDEDNWGPDNGTFKLCGSDGSIMKGTFTFQEPGVYLNDGTITKKCYCY